MGSHPDNIPAYFSSGASAVAVGRVGIFTVANGKRGVFKDTRSLEGNNICSEIFFEYNGVKLALNFPGPAKGEILHMSFDFMKNVLHWEDEERFARLCENLEEVIQEARAEAG